MPSPFVHSLLPTACALTLAKGLPHWSLRKWLNFAWICAALANFPDIDILPALLFPAHYQEIHRAWGHNIFSSLVWAYFGAWCLGRFVSPHFKGRKGLWFGMSLVASHLILDATAQHSSFGATHAIPLFWPFSQELYSIPVTLFETMNFGNLSFHLLSLPFDEILTSAFWREITQCELLPSLFLYCLFWLGLEAYQFVVARTGETRANRYSVREPDQAISLGKSLS